MYAGFILASRVPGGTSKYLGGESQVEHRRRENRSAVGAEGVEFGEGAWPSPNDLGGLGSVVSSPSGFRGGAPTANDFNRFLGLQNDAGST